MLNRTTLMASAIAALVVSACALMAQPGQAQTTTAQAKDAKADECLSRPGAVAPKGSHWFYRIERANGGRRCWYLGPASQKVRRAATTERKAAPPPASLADDEAPPLPRARTQSRSVAPQDAATDETSTASNTGAPSTVDTVTVSAAQFSSAWPVAARPADSNDHNTATTANDSAADEPAAVETAEAEEEMPAVWPVMTAAERAAVAEQPSNAVPGLGHLVIFLGAMLAFVAISARVVFKLAASRHSNVAQRPDVQPAGPVIRRRAIEPVAPEDKIEAMSEPAIARLREIAKRWDTPTRVPRQPRIPAFEVEPDYAVETELPRRRAVA
jgi:hypothetical protein